MLTDAGVRAAKPKDRAYKLTDGGGLVLFVTPSVGLGQAREQREAAKALLRAGKDPGLEKKLRRAAGGDAAGSFEAIAREWHARNLPTWTERHGKDVLDSLEGYVLTPE